MAIAPLLVRISTSGAAALGRAAAQFRTTAAAVGAAGRAMTRHTRQVSSVAGAYRDANGLWRNANGTLLTQRHTVTTVTTAFGRLVRMLHRVRTAALGAAAAIGGALRRALRAAADAAFNLVKTLAKWLALKAPLVAVGVALLPVVSNLLGLSMLLAPAVVAVAAAFATWKLATKGFGDALNASDAEELAAALKKLSPSAQSAALTLRDLGREWKVTQQKVQEAFFKGARQDFIMLSHAMQAIADRWLPKLATAFGNLRTWMTQALTGAAVSGQLDTIMAGVQRFIDGVVAAIPYLTQAFLDIAEVAAPSFGELGDSISGMAQRFADWIRKLKDDGTLKEWLDKAKASFQKVVDIGKEIGLVFKELFKGADDGDGFLTNLKNSIAEFRKWLGSENGQKTIDGFLKGAEALANLVVWIGKVSQAFAEFRDWLHGVGDSIKGIFSTLAGAATAMFAVFTGGGSSFGWISGIVSRLGGLVAAVQGTARLINAALASIRTSVFIDIITRRFDNGSKGYAKGIGSGGGGGAVPKYYAKGGRVKAGVPIVVGDGGRPELFVPDSAGRILPKVPAGMGAGGGRVDVAVRVEAAPGHAGNYMVQAILSALHSGHLRLKAGPAGRIVPA